MRTPSPLFSGLLAGIAFIWTFPLTAQEPQVQPAPAAEAKDDATVRTEGSYAIGTHFASQFSPGELDLEAFFAGFKDKLGEGPLDYTDAEIQAALTGMKTLINREREAQREKDAAVNLKASESFLAANKAKEGVTTTESGLQYEIITAGSGQIPRRTDRVQVHYHGTLIDGTVFDSSKERGQPAEFSVGGVIQGWQEALTLMPVGSTWRLFIPPDLAYGDQGSGRSIGPNQALIFEVELIEIKKVQAVTPPVAVPPRPKKE